MEEIITTDLSADMINEYNDLKISWKIFMTTLHKELLSDHVLHGMSMRKSHQNIS